MSVIFTLLHVRQNCNIKITWQREHGMSDVHSCAANHMSTLASSAADPGGSPVLSGFVDGGRPAAELTCCSLSLSLLSEVSPLLARLMKISSMADAALPDHR